MKGPTGGHVHEKWYDERSGTLWKMIHEIKMVKYLPKYIKTII